MDLQSDEKVERWNSFCKRDAELQSRFNYLLAHGGVEDARSEIEAIAVAKRENAIAFVLNMVGIGPITEVLWYLEQSANVVALFDRQLRLLGWPSLMRTESPYVMALTLMNEKHRVQIEDLNDALSKLRREGQLLKETVLALDEQKSALLARLPVLPWREDRSIEVGDMVGECKRIRRIGKSDRYSAAIATASRFHEKFRPLCENEALVSDTVETLRNTSTFALKGDDKCRVLSAEPAFYFSDTAVFCDDIPPFISVPRLVDEITIGIKNKVDPGPMGRKWLEDASS